MLFKDIQTGITVTYNGEYWSTTVEILGFLLKSRTRVTVKDICRGPGWDEETQKYAGVKVPGGWYRGQNYGYSQQFVTHLKNLEPFNQSI